MATIFPVSASVGQIFDGYEFNGTAWKIIGVDLTEDYVTQNEFDAKFALFSASAPITYDAETQTIGMNVNDADLVIGAQVFG